MKQLRIFVDIDGVLADFDFSASKKLDPEDIPLAKNLNMESSLLSPSERELKRKRWLRIEQDKNFWLSFPMIKRAKRFCGKASALTDKIFILSAVPKADSFSEGDNYLKKIEKDKTLWVQRNLGKYFNSKKGNIIVTGKHKDNFIDSGFFDILVDDREKNIDEWEAKGGYGVLFKNPLEAEIALNKILNKIYGVPEFRYHPTLLLSDAVTLDKETVCDCCGKKVNIYTKNIYCEGDVNAVCLDCVKSGKAAQKFDGCFSQGGEAVKDKEKDKELFSCTPGYSSWQGEYWLACCGDYCSFLGDVNLEELEELGITDEVFEDYKKQGELAYDCEDLCEDGFLCGYLFRCNTCGKFRIWIDCD